MSATATSFDLLREVELMQYTQDTSLACWLKIGLLLSRRECMIEKMLIYSNAASGTAMFLYEFGKNKILLHITTSLTFNHMGFSYHFRCRGKWDSLAFHLWNTNAKSGWIVLGEAHFLHLIRHVNINPVEIWILPSQTSRWSVAKILFFLVR